MIKGINRRGGKEILMMKNNNLLFSSPSLLQSYSTENALISKNLQVVSLNDSVCPFFCNGGSLLCPTSSSEVFLVKRRNEAKQLPPSLFLVCFIQETMLY